MLVYKRFRSLFLLAAPHRGKLILSGICALLSELVSLIPFLLVAQLAALFLENNWQQDKIILITGIALGAIVLRYVLLSVDKILSHFCAFETMYDLQLRLAQKIGCMPLGTVNARGSSTLKKIILQDTDIVHTIIGHYFSDFIAGLVVPIVTILIFFALDWRLALAAAAVLPFFYATWRLSYRDFKEESDAYFKANEHMQSTLMEYVSGISVIKTYNRDQSTRIRNAVDGQVSQIVRWTKRTMLPWSGFNILADLSLLFILPVGVYLVTSGLTTPQTLTAFLLLGIGYLQPLIRMSIQIGFLNYASRSIERIEDILYADTMETRGAGLFPSGNNILIENIHFSHGKTEALKDLSLSIREGTLCAIVGPSGAGKTTLAQLIGRFWDVESGSIKIGGVDLRDINEAELYKRISFVFQDVFLFNGTIAENLRLARPEATDDELIRAATAARAHDFIMQLPNGYDSHIGEKGGLLSGGQKQRLSIARAILRDAPVLVLDEATAYADPVNEYEIQKALATLMKGRTVIMIAHRLSTIVHADQIAVLDDGRLVESGTHSDLLKKHGLYTRLWNDYTSASRFQLGHDVPKQKGIAA